MGHNTNDKWIVSVCVILMCHENDLLEQKVQNSRIHFKWINIFNKKSLFCQIIQRIFVFYSSKNEPVDTVSGCKSSDTDNFEDMQDFLFFCAVAF